MRIKFWLKLSIVVFAIITPIIVSFGILWLNSITRVYSDSLHEMVTIIASSLQKSYELEQEIKKEETGIEGIEEGRGELDIMFDLLDTKMIEYKDKLLGIRIIDSQEKVEASTYGDIGKPYALPADLEHFTLGKRTYDKIENRLYIVRPIVNKKLVIEVDITPFITEISEAKRTIVSIGGGFIVVSVLIILFVSKRFSRNIALLIEGLSRIGQGDYTAVIEVNSRDEFHDIAAATNSMGKKIYSHEQQIIQQKDELEKLYEDRKAQELDNARQVQQSMVPKNVPDSDDFEIYGRTIAMTIVSGDAYDIIYDEKNLVVAIFDAVGHSFPAAFLAAMCQSAIRATYDPDNVDPLKMIRRANVVVKQLSDLTKFVTAALFTYNPERSTIISCGHPPAIHYKYSTGQAEFLPVSDSFVIGVCSDGDFAKFVAEKPVHLESGDILFLYSDGILEMRNPEGEMFGEERLKEYVAACWEYSAHDIVEAIFCEFQKFHQQESCDDDLTLLAIKKK